MIICMIMDQYYAENNGTTVSARRFVEKLRERGHEVRVVTTGKGGKDMYIVPQYKYGLISYVASWQGMAFGKPDKEVLRRAITGCDVVHCYMPFKLSSAARKMAKQLGVPCTAAFHVQPENITYNCGLKSLGWTNSIVYEGFRQAFYKKIECVHCPSEFIANELRSHHYSNNLYVISNGVQPAFKPQTVERPEELKGKFLVLMIGRFAVEKRQTVLIKAIAQSKYRDDIVLILAGAGPTEHKLRALSDELHVNTIFGFYNQQDLIKTINMCDLYVHAADVEIEAISCIEAFSCGLVPVICNSDKSATKQFALDDRSLFKVNDSEDLAKKIDYWHEHEDEKKVMSVKYIEHGKQYSIENSITKFENMLKEAIGLFRKRHPNCTPEFTDSETDTDSIEQQEGEMSMEEYLTQPQPATPY